MTDKLAKLDETIGGFLNGIDKALDTYNPGNVQKSNFLAGVALAVHANYKLQEAIGQPLGRDTLAICCKRAMSMGISLHPDDGQAGLAVYKGVVSILPMKNLIIKRAMDSGKVELIDCDTVRANDSFTLTKTAKGTDLVHGPARKDRGGIDGFYASVELTNGKTKSVYMTIEEVEIHRDKYGNGADKSDSAWGKSFEGMALKTVIKKLLRNLHVSDEVDRLVGVDDASESGFVIDAEIVPESPAAAVAARIEQETETEKDDSPI